MNERKFINHHNIIVYALSLLNQRFQKQDNLFAAQCIWWLANILQYSKILKYHFEYLVFPSDYLRDCIVTTFQHQDDIGTIVPVLDIPVLDLHYNSDIKGQSCQEEVQISRRSTKQKQLIITWSGRVFKNKTRYREPTILELEQHFAKHRRKQRRCSKDRLRAEFNDTWN